MSERLRIPIIQEDASRERSFSPVTGGNYTKISRMNTSTNKDLNNFRKYQVLPTRLQIVI